MRKRTGQDGEDGNPVPLPMKLFMTAFLSIFLVVGVVAPVGMAAQIIRDADGFGLLALLFPLIFSLMFLGIPGFMLYAVWSGKMQTGTAKSSGPKWSGPPSKATGAVPKAVTGPGPRQVQASASPMTKFVGITIFGVLWNGFIGTMAVMVAMDGNYGELFCFSPFILVGLGLIAGSIHSGLALMNPRPIITIDPGTVRLGHEITVSWAWEGRADRISRLELHLKGVESATYRRGTNTVTDRETFHDQTVIDARRDSIIRKGKATVTLPLDTMHTLKANSHAIAWTAELRGHIPRWPDVSQSYEIEVLPVELVEE